MRAAFVAGALLLASSLARAGTLTGSIDDPALRRRTHLVYVETVPGRFTPPAAAVMKQAGGACVPTVLPVIAGQKVEFRASGEAFEKSFGRPGVFRVSCDVREETRAHVVVLQNPFYAVPDGRTGRFTIDGLPEGSYTLRLFGPDLSDEERQRQYTVTVAGAPLKVM